MMITMKESMVTTKRIINARVGIPACWEIEKAKYRQAAMARQGVFRQVIIVCRYSISVLAGRDYYLAVQLFIFGMVFTLYP